MAKQKKIKEPQFLPSPLNNPMLNYKVYYMATWEKILFTLLTFIAGGIVSQVFYGNLFKTVDGKVTTATHISNVVVFVLIGCLAVRFFLPAIVQSLKDKRDKKLTKQFMDLLDMLTSSLSAGNTVNDSFYYAKRDLMNQYTERDYIIQELNEILDGIKNGRTLEDMLLSFGKRSNNEEIENFSNVISNCYRLGGNFRDVIINTRGIISDKIAISDEIDTKLSSNTMQLNVMSLMPVPLVGMIKVVSKDFADNLATPMGVFATTIAIGIFIAAYLWGRKIINIR